MTELYAIFHRPTGKYMPAQLFKTTKGGYTWWDPTNPEYSGYVPGVPRFFSSLNAATVAKSYWLKGEHRRRYSGHYEDFECWIECKPAAVVRKAEDIEIHVINPVITRVI